MQSINEPIVFTAIRQCLESLGALAPNLRARLFKPR
jgi:hypothetical protein